MLLAIALSLAFQYGVAGYIIDHQRTFTALLADAWTDGCTQYGDLDLQKSCAGNNGVYRVASATTLFFAFAAVAVRCKPTANREAWPAKYILFLFLCGVTIVIPNEPLFAKVFLNIARIGAIIFILLQQLIIIDVAYDWNDSWVMKADKAESEEPGSGKRWLGAILASCVILWVISLTVYVLLIVNFTGCPTNNFFIGATLVLGLAIVLAQMTGEEGSLLSSSCIFAWAVFLCYTAVSKNPSDECNPKLGELDRVGIATGLVVTMMSLAWTGWSWTAEDKLAGKKEDSEDSDASPTNASPLMDDSKKVSGVVVGNANGDDAVDEETGEATSPSTEDPRRLSNSWKLNLILACVTCWMAMTLTNWGAIAVEGNAANPQVGRIGMWMVVTAQWIALVLYLWTLVAPRLFPNREFS